MSFTFTKLSSDIIHSSVWCEPMPTKIVWITLLAMADQYGRIGASVPGLAKAAGVAVEEAQTALDRFLSPDPWSRTPDFEGRRIEKIDGGWRLLNYEKNRAKKDEEKQLKRHAKNQAAYRDRQKEKVTDKSDRVTDHVTESDPIAEAEAEAEAEKKLASSGQRAGASPTAPKPEPGASFSAKPAKADSKPAESKPASEVRSRETVASEASEQASEPLSPTPFEDFVEHLSAMVQRLTGYEQDIALENKESSRLEPLFHEQEHLESFLSWALQDSYWNGQMLGNNPSEAMKIFIRAFETIRKQARAPKKTAKVQKPSQSRTSTVDRVKRKPVANVKVRLTTTGEIVKTVALPVIEDGTIFVSHADNKQTRQRLSDLEEIRKEIA